MSWLTKSLDNFTDWWNEKRLAEAVRDLEEEMALTSFGMDENGYKFTAAHELLGEMAVILAEMLEKQNPRNYLAVTLIPSAKRQLDPLVVTVGWANRSSPALRANALGNYLEDLLHWKRTVFDVVEQSHTPLPDHVQARLDDLEEHGFKLATPIPSMPDGLYELMRRLEALVVMDLIKNVQDGEEE